MDVLQIKSNKHQYPIYLQKDLRFKVGKLINADDYSKIVVITDEQVDKLYLNDVLNSLNHTNVTSYVVPNGEQSKSLTIYEKVQQFLLEQHVDRHSAIIALGGGVVGDLAGFVAATFMRGISLIQMPTTLLAHDSSIGGKVAINLSETKNIIGSFYPPECVIFDVDTLKTLDEQQLRSGFAEMIKHGFIADQELLLGLQNTMSLSINPNTDDFKPLLKRSLQVKQKFVEQDEKESHIRQYLNFGHTLGHAIEAFKKDSLLTHGECVMVGMLFSLYLSEQVQQKTHSFLTQGFINWIKALNYPLSIISKNDIDFLIEKMLNDKKNINNQVNFVLLKEIGKPFIHSYTEKEIKKHLEKFIELDVLKDVKDENN